MKNNPIIFLAIGLAIAFLFRDEFATAVRVKFPATDGPYWQISPNRHWWVGLQGERTPVSRDAGGGIFPPPPVPPAGEFTDAGLVNMDCGVLR